MDHLSRRNAARTLRGLEVDALLLTRLPNVRYLTGFTGSSACLLAGPAGSVFFTDGRYGEQSRHEVPDLLRSRRPRRCSADPRARRPPRGPRLGFEKHAVTVGQLERWEDALDGVTLTGIGEEVERQRWTKDAEEPATLRAAQDATDRAFEESWTRSSSGSPSASRRATRES